MGGGDVLDAHRWKSSKVAARSLSRRDSVADLLERRGSEFGPDPSADDLGLVLYLRHLFFQLPQQRQGVIHACVSSFHGYSLILAVHPFQRVASGLIIHSGSADGQFAGENGVGDFSEGEASKGHSSMSAY